MEWPKACSLFTEIEESRQGPQEPQQGPQEPQQGPQEPQQELQIEESPQGRRLRKKKMTLHYCMLSKSALLQIVCETS